MSCIASSFVGSVAALKATKVQVRFDTRDTPVHPTRVVARLVPGPVSVPGKAGFPGKTFPR